MYRHGPVVTDSQQNGSTWTQGSTDGSALPPSKGEAGPSSGVAADESNAPSVRLLIRRGRLRVRLALDHWPRTLRKSPHPLWLAHANRLWGHAWDRVLQGFDRPFLRSVYSLGHGMNRHGVTLAASAMAFDLFLSLIPLLALAGWLFTHALYASQGSLGFVSTLLDLTPLQVQEILSRHIGRFSAGIAPLAAFGTLYLASGAFHTAQDVVEQATGAHRRSWWTKRLIAMACAVGVVFLIALSATVAVALIGGPGRMLETVMGGRSVPNLARYVTYSVAIFMATLGLALFLRIAVHQPGCRRRVWPGALLTMGIGVVASWGFTEYLQTLARYTLYYGSLATVAVTLAWLYLWCLALLVGAELNAQLENERRRTMPRQVRRQRRGELVSRPWS